MVREEAPLVIYSLMLLMYCLLIPLESQWGNLGES